MRGRSAPGSTARVRRIIVALILASLVFAGFIAYAYLAQTTYETHTEVTLDVPAGLDESVHPIADSRSRLEKELRGPASLKALGAKLRVSSPEARLALARSLETQVEVATKDGRLFSITCRADRADMAQRLCRALGEAAANTLPKTAFRNDMGGQRTHVEDLLAFLSEHPELSRVKDANAPAGDTGEVAPASGEDPLLRALTQQRWVVLGELKELQKVDPKNPYASDLGDELKGARERLAALDAAIAKRGAGLANTDPPAAGAAEHPSADQAVLTGLAQRLKKLSNQPAAVNRLRASVTRAAALPASPIRPDRAQTLTLGALAAIGVLLVGLGVAFAARQPERTSPSPQPQPQPLQAEPLPPLPQLQAAQVAVSPDTYTANIRTYAAALDVGEPVPPQDADAPPLGRPEDGVAEDLDEVRAPDHPKPDARAPFTATVPMVDWGNGSDAPPGAAEEVRGDDESPRTQLGGFGSAPPPEEPSRPGSPISVKGLIALGPQTDDAGEAHAEGDSPDSDAAPQTLIGGAQASVQDRPATPNKAYTPPKRNITRRLGSLSWLDQAELTGGTPQPVSTRYSYVSSRPPPPDASASEVPRRALRPSDAPSPEIVEVVPAEDPVTGIQLQRSPGAGVNRHPVVLGWQPPARTLDTQELLVLLQEKRTAGCLVVGVTARSDSATLKSHLASNLAFGFDHLGQPRALLMEGDFQEPKVHRTVGIEMPMAGGLSRQLQQRLSGSANAAWDVVQCGGLDVLAEGFIRSPGAILSRHFEQCVRELRNTYDFIVVDGPALSSSSECQAFADVVDAVVLCAPPNRPDVQALIQDLFGQKRFIGVYPAR